jgi:hypothetical protein
VKTAEVKTSVPQSRFERSVMMENAKEIIAAELHVQNKLITTELRAYHLLFMRFGLRFMLDVLSDKDCRKSKVVQDIAKGQWLDDLANRKWCERVNPGRRRRH